jgi:hypothetical protein
MKGWITRKFEYALNVMKPAYLVYRINDESDHVGGRKDCHEPMIWQLNMLWSSFLGNNIYPSIYRLFGDARKLMICTGALSYSHGPA